MATAVFRGHVEDGANATTVPWVSLRHSMFSPGAPGLSLPFFVSFVPFVVEGVVAVAVSLSLPFLVSLAPFVVEVAFVCASTHPFPGFITLPPVAAFRMATHDFRTVSLG